VAIFIFANPSLRGTLSERSESKGDEAIPKLQGDCRAFATLGLAMT